MKEIASIVRSWGKKKHAISEDYINFNVYGVRRAGSASLRLTKHAGIYGRHAMRRTKTGLSMRSPKCIQQ